MKWEEWKISHQKIGVLFLGDNNTTDPEPHIPTIMATPLVETSLFTNILSPSVEDQINSFVSSDTENDNN